MIFLENNNSILGGGNFKLNRKQFFLIWKKQFKTELTASYNEYKEQFTLNPKDCMDYNEYCKNVFNVIPHTIENTNS
jgi:hypothetical protein